MNEKELARQFFETDSPSAALVPNMIALLDSDLFHAIVAINGAKPGVWNASAPFDDNDRYQPFRDDLPLSAWSLAYNQNELLNLVGYSNTLVFANDTIIVDSDTAPGLLESIEADREERAYYELDVFPKLLPKIGWALMSIGPERNYGLFLTSDAKSNYITLLQKWCHERGRGFYRVAMAGGEPVMVAHTAPDESRMRLIREQGLQFVAKMAQLGISVHEIGEHLPDILKLAEEFKPE